MRDPAHPSVSITKSPVTATSEMYTFTAELLANVTVCTSLNKPTMVSPNSSKAGDTLISGAVALARSTSRPPLPLLNGSATM